MTTSNPSAASLTGVVEEYAERLSTLQSIRCWALNDPARMRDAEFLAAQAIKELRTVLGEPAKAPPNLAPEIITQFSNELSRAQHEAQLREPQASLTRRAISFAQNVSVLSVISYAVVVILAVIAVFNLLPAAVFPNHAVRLAHFQQMREALQRYHVDTGHYPVTHSPATHDWIGFAWNGDDENWIPELVPKYLPKSPLDPRNTRIKEAQYVFRSDGSDYKLVVLSPEDCVMTTLLKPWLKDPARAKPVCAAYGIWTRGAVSW